VNGARRTLGLIGSVAGLIAANVAVGRALSRSGRVRERETAVILRLQDHRTPARDTAARTVSTVADVPASVAHGLLAVAVLAARTRNARLAGVPALALVVESATYLAAGALVARGRPDVPHLDREQPTSSFPSGHQGATVALMASYALLAGRLCSPAARRAIGAACLAGPAVLAWARVHTGMHYPSDVVAGTLNGLVAGALAWRCLAGAGTGTPVPVLSRAQAARGRSSL
jgi:undecaprenyl-diphosphatase